MEKGERFWGLERDTIAAEVLKLPVKEWTITMLSNMVEVSVKDNIEESLDTLPDYFDSKDWWNDQHKYIDLPRGIQMFQMHKLEGDSDDCHYGIADFSSVIGDKRSCF